MDKIEKALRKLSDEERMHVEDILQKLSLNQIKALDIKKLKGYRDIFRIRKGKLRIIFRTEDGKIYLLKIDRRNDTTYNSF